MKMEKETFDVLVKQVKDAVIEDLTSIDPTRTILKARIWCRDDEDQFDLYCLYDFSPYMDMLFRQFEPDVRMDPGAMYMPERTFYGKRESGSRYQGNKSLCLSVGDILRRRNIPQVLYYCYKIC